MKEMDLRHKIDDEYNTNPRHIKQWNMTIEWLKQFDIKGFCIDCGERSKMTDKMEEELNIGIATTYTEHDLNVYEGLYWDEHRFDNIFAFEVIEHLLNPLIFMKWINENISKTGIVYLSTPINRPNWIRNKVRHFHEFNYNELMHLIDVAGFKVVNEKIINPSVRWWTGFRPVLRKFFGCGNNILLRLKRKE